MHYFFILGNNPTLSMAELLAVFRLKDAQSTQRPFGRWVSRNVFILETDKKIKALEIIKKLGGTIKIGAISCALSPGNKEQINENIKKIINNKEKQGKFKFGFSYYGLDKFNFKPIGMETKKYLKAKGVNSRWVTSREPTLSSVVVEQNKLINKGIEIVLIENNKKMLLGQTLAIQPFKELSLRDYGRPARDDYSGMLPPKLAQIMINLARPSGTLSLARRGKEDDYNQVILDPFCGSGTILTEALLMGYRNLIGSDISLKAVSDTEKNIGWIKKKFEISASKFQLYNKNAVELSKFIKPNTVDAIITEPYLGPQRGKINIKKTTKELEKLYSASLAEFKKILRPNGRVVMVWPAFVKTMAGKPAFAKTSAGKLVFINPDLNGFKIINLIPEYLQKHPAIKLTVRNTIIYGRAGQRVWREIIVLK